MNLLLVDDDPDARLLAGWTLEKEDGWTVSTAEDGESAEASLVARTPDVVLLDYFLGEVDGLELLDRWRKAGILGRAQVIVLSGKGSALDASARAQGALGVIAKPFDPARLVAQIRELLPCLWT